MSICCPFETKKPRTKIETFAEQHRLKVTRDECNAPTIPGRRGHPYFDGAELCLMVLDGKPAIRSKMEGAGRQAVDGGYQQERPRRAGSGRENHRMNAEEFVTVVKLHERRSDTLKVLERPPGRSRQKDFCDCHAGTTNLPASDQEMLGAACRVCHFRVFLHIGWWPDKGDLEL